MVTTLNELMIKAELEHLRSLDPWITHFVNQIPDEIEARNIFSSGLVLAVHEVMANQIDHAYQHAEGDIALGIEYNSERAAVIIHIQDWGKALDIGSLPHTVWRDTPDGHQLISVQEPEWDQDRGRGLFLIHTLTHQVVYQPRPGTNVWTLTKFIHAAC